MPLLKGRDRNIISENIRELRNTGHSEDQAIAIALHKSREDEPGPDDDQPVPEGHIRDKRTGKVRRKTMFDVEGASDAVKSLVDAGELSEDTKAKAADRNRPVAAKPAEKKDAIKPFKGAKATTHTSPR